MFQFSIQTFVVPSMVVKSAI